MASGTLIKFFTGTTYQLSNLTQNLNQYIALNTQTGEMFWNHNGTKYYMNYRSDWDISDSSLPSYIANKPSIPTIQDLLSEVDFSQVSDSFIATHREPINPGQVTGDGNGRFYLQLGKRRPTQLITNSGSMYSIQTESLSITSDNVFTIQLSRYMAYQNKTTVPSGWVLLYS